MSWNEEIEMGEGTVCEFVLTHTTKILIRMSHSSIFLLNRIKFIFPGSVIGSCQFSKYEFI